MYEGLIIKESLKNESILERLDIIKTEVWDVDNASEDQPKQWHVSYFQVEENKIDDIAEQISKSLQNGKWYVNFSGNVEYTVVVFPDKVFKYKKGDIKERAMAVEYGRGLQIPESQLDWPE